MYQGYIPKNKKNRRPVDEIAPKMKLLQKNKIPGKKQQPKYRAHGDGRLSAFAGNQLPNQLQKGVLPALFHLRCPSQSHQRSARGLTRLTTVSSNSCRSLERQLHYLSVMLLCVHNFPPQLFPLYPLRS